MAKSNRKSNGEPIGFAATLWAAADKLPGHTDAAEYKLVVIGGWGTTDRDQRGEADECPRLGIELLGRMGPLGEVLGQAGVVDGETPKHIRVVHVALAPSSMVHERRTYRPPASCASCRMRDSPVAGRFTPFA